MISVNHLKKLTNYDDDIIENLIYNLINLSDDDINESNINKYFDSKLISVKYRNLPVIFSGSNSWFEKYNKPEQYYFDRLNRLSNVFSKINSDNSLVLVIPEKDYLLKMEDDNFNTYEIKNSLNKYFQSFKFNFLFDDFIKYIKNFQLNHYSYYDSHLLSRDYLYIFFSIISKLSLEDFFNISDYTLIDELTNCDLAEKYSEKIMCNRLSNSYRNDNKVIITGNQDFVKPLSLMKQIVFNPNAKSSKRILIFGDSHSSLFSKKFLTYLLSSIFEEVTFCWDFFNSSDTKTDDFDYVIYEASLRFFL